jgi:hypothetical protein
MRGAVSPAWELLAATSVALPSLQPMAELLPAQEIGDLPVQIRSGPSPETSIITRLQRQGRGTGERRKVPYAREVVRRLERENHLPC